LQLADQLHPSLRRAPELGLLRSPSGPSVVHRGLGAILCILVVAAAMACLWLGLSGLMVPDPAGGLLRTLGGFVGFFAVFLLTLVAMQRS